MKKLFTLILCQLLLTGLALNAQCTFGNYPPVYTSTTVSLGDNFLLGTKYTLSTTGTLMAIGYKGVTPGAQIRMAIYASNAGSPSYLVANTNTSTVQAGNHLLPVTSPVVLPPGDYFIVGNYSVSPPGPQVNSVSSTTNVVYYSPQQFTSAITYSPTWQSFTGNDFNYWADLNPMVQIAGVQPICKGASLTLTASGATTYTWSTLSSNTVVTVNPTLTTTYSVIGTWTNGCYHVATTTITVLVSPTITINSGTICAGNTFTLQPGGATSYTFSSGTATVAPQQTTNYTVSGTSSGGCVGTRVATVVVNASPVLTINSGSVCLGSNYTLTPGGAVNYTIQGGSSVVSPASTSTYSIAGADAIGCKNTITATVSVLALPTLSLSSSNSSLCAGEEGTLTVSGASSYSWNTNATNPSISVSPAITSTYSVKGTDANGCSTTATIVQSVNLCTGLENSTSKAQSIRFYPNPTKGVVMMDAIAFSATSQIKIYNALGQKVFSDFIRQESFSVDLKDFSNGIYTFQITETSNSVQYFKVIKN
ncbi:hypothetical protein CNR22_04800 [Sphingobacteriaceae bacterium]|nr:hypothetical protein CNR22_04800 [Sphingobacteriaceae bacterium]